MTGREDRWTEGSTYEDFMGRWSRRLALRFVAWLGVPPGLDWLDVGCGTGALAEAICRQAAPASVLGCDPSESFVDFARKRFPDPRVRFQVAGTGNLPGRSEGFGCVASCLALNFFPDPKAALGEMRSLAAARGTLAACVWDYREGMQILRTFWDAATSIDPSARELDEGNRFPLCRPEALVDLFQEGGLGDVRCDSLEILTEFANFDDYWRPFLGGTGPAPAFVSSLDERRRADLKGRLQAKLQPGGRGSIPLQARAWAVSGSVR